MKKRSRGFTLIELLAVIAILGILISITTVAVNTLRKKQEEINKKNVISSILTGAKERNAKEKINVGDSVSVKSLKEKSYVDFDEEKYSEFLSKEVTKSQCSENPLKIKYSIVINEDGTDVTYNDCGCEKQQSDNNNSEELCKEKNG